MRHLTEELERRDHPRLRQRLPCSLLVDGKGYRGVVRDLSAGGLLLETDAQLEAGGGALVILETPGGAHFVLEGARPERRPIARSLCGATREATVLRIQYPPRAWLRYLEATLAREDASA
jgi:PilZ domain